MADPISATVAAISAAVTSATAATASALAAVGFSAGAAKAVATAVFSYNTLFTVAGFAASALLTPQVNAEGSPTDWRAEPNAGIPFVMGERATSGIIVHRDAYGLDNRLQSIVTVYSGAGPIQSFDQFYADDVAMTFDANGEATNGGTFAGNMWLYTTPGDQPQSAALANNSVLNSQIGSNAFEGWSSTSKISGKAHALLTLRQDSKLKTYAGGIPRARFKMRGIKMYDPRLDSTVAGGSGSHRVADQSTYAYSENPAIAALNWCLGLKEDGVVVGGIGAEVDGIDLPAFIEWANVCDANGWTVSAAPTSSDDKHQVLLALMQAGGARYSRFQGKMSCIVRTPRTSVVTLSADDTAGPFEIDLNADRLTRTNTITPRCVMESHAWELVAQDPVTESSYVTADGGERARGIDYPFVAIKADNSNKDQPSQLAAYAIVDSRETIAGTVPLKPWGAQIEPGDVFTIDEPGFLLDGVELLCVRREFDLANNIVRVSFISESAGKHTYALGLDPTPPTAPGLTAPDIYDVPAPGVAVWSAAAGTGNQPSIRITGEADQLSARAFIVEYRTQDDPNTGSPWSDADDGWTRYGEFDIATTDVTITGLEPSTVYEVAVRYISQFGVIGDRRNLGTVTTAGLIADQVGALTQTDIDGAIADAQAAADDAQAEIDAARDALDDTQATFAEALTADRAAISQSIDDARLEGRVQISRLSAPKQNLVLDALFTLGARDWRKASGGQPFIDMQTSPRALRLDFTATGAGEAASAYLLDEYDVAPGERFELAGEADIEGVADSPVLRLVWINAAGDDTTASEVSLTDLFSRQGGFVTAPAGAAKARLEVAVDATGAGDGVLRVRRIMWRLADDGQSTLTAFSDEDSAIVARLKREAIASSETVAQTLRLSVADGQRQAEIENIEITQTDGGSALAAQIESVEARTSTAEADIDSLQQSVATGNAAQAKDILSLTVATRGLNAFDDPLFQTGAQAWRGTPIPPLIDQTGDTRAILTEGAASGSGTVAVLRYPEWFRVEEGQGVEAAADVKFTGTISSASVRVRWYDASETLLSTDTAGSAGGSGTYARLGGFVTAPAGAKYAEFRIEATGTAGDVALYMRRPHFGGQADGQTTLTAFDATLDPRTATILRGLQADSWRSMETFRLAVEAGEASAAITAEQSARISGDNALATRATNLEARATNLEAEQGSQGGRLDTAEASITTLESTTASLEADKAEASVVTGIEARVTSAEGAVSDLEGEFGSGGRVTTAEANITTAQSAIADLETGKAEASDLTSLEARVDQAEGDIDAAQSSITTLSTVKADAADLTAEANRIDALEVSVGGNTAQIAVNAQAVADLESAAAIYEILVAASGGNPAVVRLLSGVGGSEVALSADKLRLNGVQIFSEDGAEVLMADTVRAQKVAANTVTAEQIVSRSLGEKVTAYNEQHAFFNYTGSAGAWTGNTSEFTDEILNAQTSDPVEPGDFIEVLGDHRIETVFNAFTLLTWRHRVGIIAVDENGSSAPYSKRQDGRYVPEFFSVAANTDNLGSYGSADISKSARTVLRYTVPSDWPSGAYALAYYRVEAWNSGRGDSRAMHRASGVNLATSSNLFLRDVSLILSLNKSGIVT